MINNFAVGSLATSQLVASYPEYAGAQRAVDHLADEKFPVEHSTIVGSELRMVETVLGRLNYGRAAAAGASSGAWFGLLVGVFLGIFATTGSSVVGLVLWGLVFGALAGAAFGLVGHAMSGGRRDFVSRQQLTAGRYDVLVSGEYANQARTLLEKF